MSLPSYLLVFLYLILVLFNYQGFLEKRHLRLITIMTVLLSTFMLFSANAADLDWSETELDMSGYRTLYEQYNVLEHVDFNLYYLFYSFMYVGQSLGISFRLWWTIMSFLAMGVILFACKVHNYNLNLFIASFMAYHEIVFYSGIKFFYGFCFLLLAYGFLLDKNRKRHLLFALFTCIAGGFHVMYYFFLILLIRPLKNQKLFVGIVVGVTFLFTIVIRLSGSALSFLMPFFDVIDNDHINRYTEVTVHFGFYLALFIHLVVVYVVYKIRLFKKNDFINNNKADTLYYTVLISLIVIPFYSVAMTFMRFITAFSLVVIAASSSILVETYKSRLLCAKMSILVVVSFYFIRFLMGIVGFFQTAIVPYFDVF